MPEALRRDTVPDGPEWLQNGRSSEWLRDHLWGEHVSGDLRSLCRAVAACVPGEACELPFLTPCACGGFGEAAARVSMFLGWASRHCSKMTGIL
jgi:hypothetical protein